MTLASGTRLGRYEVRAPLGAGGMGEVYVAYDVDLERHVAIKVLRDGAEESGDRVRRFIQEAKAASALNHPNVAQVYEIGTHENLRFIVMEIVEGETLRKHLGTGRLSIEDALGHAIQIAAGLAAAHRAGIVHRDIKPENVMIRPDGYAKILDFGLAKLREVPQDAATILKTGPGVTLGTLGYMAPEQLSGGEITPAADVFSLGVVLYEMISGHRPFEGVTATEIITAVLSRTPRPLTEEVRNLPPKLGIVITRALAKDPRERYPSAREMLDELKQISRESLVESIRSDPEHPVVQPSPRRSKTIVVGIAAVIIVAAIVAAWWMLARSKRIRHARESIATAEQLLALRRLPEAFAAASAAAAVLPEDDRLRELIVRTSVKALIESEPPGATVFLQHFKGPAERVRAGTTPLTISRLPKADYIATFERTGYATTTRPLAAAPIYARGGEGPPPAPDIKAVLGERTKVPPEMEFVPAGEYRLTGWSRASEVPVLLRDYLIDRYEVSNRDFEDFVRAGGYRRPEFWKHPFVLGGKTISFEQAMARFRDKNGLPGPRHWVGGASPRGLENHPVTDVTWYEAAAFAEWKGKELPTVYQWEKAARYPMKYAPGRSYPWAVLGEGVDATERANFQSEGTMPVDTMPFGIGPYGSHHMAGNVAEWCRNPRPPGYAARGGSFRDPVYTFGSTAGYPTFYTSETLGFRCVKEIEPGPDDQGDFALVASELSPIYKAVDDRAFAEIRKRYEYAKTPLNARVVETVESPDWTRETIAYNGVKGSTVRAYMFVPKGFRPPFQVIHFAPGGDVESGVRSLPASMERGLSAAIRGGRAVFAVLLEGYIGRPRESPEPDSRTDEYVDYTVRRMIELRRGLDYVESRPDIDRSKIGFIGPSAGSAIGIFVTALDPRYRSVFLIAAGIEPTEVTDVAAANRINFAPRIAAPKLILHGRYDEVDPLKLEAEPLFRLLREPKRMIVHEGSHTPSADIAVPITQKWLDETLGPVEQ